MEELGFDRGHPRMLFMKTREAEIQTELADPQSEPSHRTRPILSLEKRSDFQCLPLSNRWG
jgi:hypothetical protein